MAFFSLRRDQLADFRGLIWAFCIEKLWVLSRFFLFFVFILRLLLFFIVWFRGISKYFFSVAQRKITFYSNLWFLSYLVKLHRHTHTHTYFFYIYIRFYNLMLILNFYRLHVFLNKYKWHAICTIELYLFHVEPFFLHAGLRILNLVFIFYLPVCITSYKRLSFPNT